MKSWILLIFCVLLIGETDAQFTIVVDSIPPNTPAVDPIHIAGNFQGWNPGSAAHILTVDSASGNRLITLHGVLGNIKFKFTRGDWSKVESSATGQFIPNRTAVATANDTLYLQIAGWEDLNGGGGPAPTTADSNVHIISDTFYMPQLDRNRRIWVYLPPDYEISSKRYPVLYMHDGQNLFDGYTSFAGEWGVDETLTSMYSSGEPGIIVVGIDNGGNFRMDEYAPWENANYGGGEGDLYLDYIIQTLKPHIDQNYRTLPDRDNTGIMGSSLGALISMYAGIRNPEVFGKIGAFSSAYWFNDPQIFDYINSTGLPTQLISRIYQNVGTQEGATMVSDMWRMEGQLIAAGADSASILSKEHLDGEHSEWFWAREFEPAVRWLFNSYLTGYENIDKADQWMVFPQPAQDRIFLNSSTGALPQSDVHLFDIAGRQISMSESASRIEGSQLTIDISEVPNGVYFLSFSSNGLAILRPVLIQR